jgi:hypothetical protein
MQDTNIIFNEAVTSFDEDRTDNHLIIKRVQDISDDFMSEIRNARDGNAAARSGEFLHVASVPEATVLELRFKYNFDVLTAPVRDTLKMLRRLHLDNFIATNKRI